MLASDLSSDDTHIGGRGAGKGLMRELMLNVKTLREENEAHIHGSSSTGRLDTRVSSTVIAARMFVRVTTGGKEAGRPKDNRHGLPGTRALHSGNAIEAGEVNNKDGVNK